MAAVVRGRRVQRVGVELGRASARSVKPITLYGTFPWLRGLAAEVRLRPKAPGLAPLAPRRAGWVNGRRRELGASAEYSAAFCSTVARMHKARRQRGEADSANVAPVVVLDEEPIVLDEEPIVVEGAANVVEGSASSSSWRALDLQAAAERRRARRTPEPIEDSP